MFEEKKLSQVKVEIQQNVEKHDHENVEDSAATKY